MIFNENGEVIANFNIINEATTQNDPSIDAAIKIFRMIAPYLAKDFKKAVVICGDNEAGDDYEIEIYNKSDKGKVACMMLSSLKRPIIGLFVMARLHYFKMNGARNDDDNPNNIAFVYTNGNDGVSFRLKIDYDGTYKTFHNNILKELQKK